MKDRDFLVIQYDMMTKLHLKPGPMRDLFAIIYNYSKDGIHTYRASMDVLAEQLGVSERHAQDLVKILLESGYINREQRVVICTRGKNKESKHAKYEYTTNYEQLLALADAGEDIRPLPMKRRAKMGGESSPILEGKMGGEISSKRVVNATKMGGESSPKRVVNAARNNKDIEGIYKDISLSESARAREAEERVFYKIFFLNNAADPAAEVKRFVGYYQSKGWEDSAGRKYDTPEKRAGLAYGWDCKSGQRLEKNEYTENFYKFLGALYDFASRRGDIEPMLILDVRGGFTFENGVFVWDCLPTVKAWFESLAVEEMRARVWPYMGNGCKLKYAM